MFFFEQERYNFTVDGIHWKQQQVSKVIGIPTHNWKKKNNVLQKEQDNFTCLCRCRKLLKLIPPQGFHKGTSCVCSPKERYNSSLVLVGGENFRNKSGSEFEVPLR